HARKDSISKTHNEQPDPAVDLRLAVRVDLVDAHGGERLTEADAPQQSRAPGGAEREYEGDGSQKERAVEVAARSGMNTAQRGRLSRRGGQWSGGGGDRGR